MTGWARHGMSYANVVSSLALFVALGGVSYAAVTLPARSVGTRQLKNNAVTGLKVRDHSLTGLDIAGGLRRGPKGETGETGPAGPPGADGAPGHDGAPGSGGVVTTHGFSGSIGTITGTGTGLGDWKFVGATDAVTVTAGQRITANAVFGLGAASAVAVASDICSQPLGGKPTPVGNHLTTSVSTRQVLTATQTFTPAAGFTTVGACIAIANGQTLDNNNIEDGWFMVTG